MMYRTNQESDKNMSEAGTKTEFIGRVYSLPIVNSALSYASDAYSHTKERNAVFKFTLGTAEKSVCIVAKTAEPVLNKFHDQIQVVDVMACKGLDTLEKKLPVITKSPEQIVEETKNLYSSYRDAGVNKYNDVKQYGSDQVSKVTINLIESPYGKFLVNKVDGTLMLADSCVDYLLPEADEEVKDEQIKNPVERANYISKKVIHRLQKRTSSKLSHLEKSTRETLTNITDALNVLEVVKRNVDSTNKKVLVNLTAAQTRINQLWVDLNKEDSGSLSEKKAIDEKALYVARKLTKQLVKTYNSAVTTATNISPTFQENVKLAQNYTVDMYSYFSKATGLEDVSAAVIEQFKPKILYIQETLGAIVKNTLSLQPLQRLVDLTKRKEVEMENLEASNNPTEMNESLDKSQEEPSDDNDSR